MPGGRPRKRIYHFSRQQVHSTTVESHVMPLNEERQVVINEIGTSNALIVLNEGEQSTSNAVILLNQEEERPRKKTYHFSRQQDHSTTVESHVMPLIEERQVINEVGTSNALIALNEGEQSTSNAGSLLNQEEESISNAEQLISDSSLYKARRARASKLKCLQYISEIGQMYSKERSRQVFKHRAKESTQQRIQRLENLKQRAFQRRASESTDSRRRRLEYLRERASIRLSSESTLERQQRLEEQRRRQARYEVALRNQCPTYKIAVSIDVEYSTLGEFNVKCIHCKALHFPEERVSNRLHRDSFGDCCLHGRLLMAAPYFANELARLFLHRHPLSEEFHKRIRNLNSCFAFSSFNVAEDRTINNHGIYSFIACGQVYHKMNLAAQPTQDIHGEFEKPQYGQMYFLDPDNAVDERLNHPLNYGISRELMELLEHIIRAQNLIIFYIENKLRECVFGEIFRGLWPARGQSQLV